MAGILDSKTRIMDVVITEQGRRQLASGMMKVEYATFTDLGSFYRGDANGVIEDPTGRIYFESSPDLPWDMVTFESDDSGYLLPFRGDDIAVGGTNLVISGSTINVTTSSAEAVSETILDSWNKMQIIRSEEIYNDTEGFQLSLKTLDFKVTDEFPFSSTDVKEAVIDDIESLDNDFRLSKLQNFKYLPPINGAGLLQGETIGDFPDLNETLDRDTQRFVTRLQDLEFADVEFIETSIENNFVMQIFEFSDDAGVVKLDVIDYGESKSLTTPDSMTRTLFAGKIIRDSFGRPTFVNIFTIELE